MDKPICLITPPSCFLLDERVFITLGILKVAASLEQRGYAVEMVDLSGIDNYLKVIADLDTDAEIFGLTATTPQMPACIKIVEVLRQRPNAKIILGGPHVTLVYAALRNERKRGVEGRAMRAYFRLAELFDVLVVGDGEDAIFQAVRPDCQKLVDADDPRADLFLTNNRLGELPLPARHLVDLDSYHYSIDGVRATSMIAQLGCPFACAFCGGRFSPMLRRIRTRTTESIVAEMRHLHETYGFTSCMLYDDELNVNKNIVELMDDIADLGEELGFEWKLRGFVKSELFTDEQAAAMHRAGFRWLLVGFESGSPRILENINKKATREDNTRCLRIAHKHGLKVKALMSLGHAGESRETIDETKAWLMEESPDDFDLTVITTYPGTPYYDQANETESGVWTYVAPNGDRLHAYDMDFNESAGYYKGIPGEYQSFVFTDYLSAKDIVLIRDKVEAEVRAFLGIPFNAGQTGKRYEASMGQMPGFIVRRSNGIGTRAEVT